MDSPPGLDLAALSRYLEHVGYEGPGAWTATLFEGGRSNLTYAITNGTMRLVLRRPPLGHVLATAHDVEREYRVVSALADTAVPVPRTNLLCTDESVIGAPFYVMEQVDGRVFRSRGEYTRLPPPRRRVIADDLVDALVALHVTDPSGIGLGDFGRPAGFLDRQVRRWSKQLESSRSREIAGIDELRDRVAASVPTSSRVGLVHGDYRLENVIIGEHDRVAAILDWEMATLGDPWTDVGLFVIYWSGVPGSDDPAFSGLTDVTGTPTIAELLDRYHARAGIEPVALDWYVAFACFKLAVILEGIHFRHELGKTVGSVFEGVSEAGAPLVQHGLEVARNFG